jgi:hypothetical protein
MIMESDSVEGSGDKGPARGAAAVRPVPHLWSPRLRIRVRVHIAAFKTCLRIEATVQFLKELAHVLGSPHIGPVLFREDNMSVIKLTEASDIPKRSRHINVKYHKVRYMARKEHIEFRHLGTELMTADILTKPFGPKRFRFISSGPPPRCNHNWPRCEARSLGCASQRHHRGLMHSPPQLP